MINFIVFFKNHFKSQRVGNARLKAFCDDHIIKLTAVLSLAPNAVLQALLDALLPLYNSFFGAITSEATKFAIQQSRTIRVDNAWDDILLFIRQKEGIVRGTWGKDSDVYQEFYPLGLDEYNTATKVNKDIILQRYFDAVTAYSVTLGAAFVTEFNDLKTNWQAAFNTQQLQIGLVKNAASQTDTNRGPIEAQLMKNVLIIASEFVGQPDKVNDFFNESLLQAPQYDLPKEGNINPGEVKLVTDLITYDPDEELEVENLSGGILEFGFSFDKKTIVGNTTTIAGVGKEKMRVGNSGVQATNVMVRSQGTVVGSYRVDRA